MKVACIQMCSGLTRARNIQDATALIEQAAAAGAAFIVTPEMTNVVDRKPRRLFENLPAQEEMEEVTAFAALAKKLRVHLLIGSMAVSLDNTMGKRKAANRAFFFDPDGATCATYDKLHMFDVDLPDGESWKESSIYQHGEEAPVVSTAHGKIGLTICYDLRFARLYRQLAQAGAEILTVPAAFTYQTGKAHWEPLLRARAIETGSFIIAAAQGGDHEDGRKTWGHSMIIDPWGNILAEKADDRPGVILADIDIEKVAKARQSIPNLSLEQPFKITNI